MDDLIFYRGYLQVAACDWLSTTKSARRFLVWDPTDSVATRPLAIRMNGTAYAYGWDLTKNVTEIYEPNGYIALRYTYTSYGQVIATGDITQSIQWRKIHHLRYCLSVPEYQQPIGNGLCGRSLLGRS